MKKMLVLLAAAALASATASAQTTTETTTPSAGYPGRREPGRAHLSPEQRAQRMTERLTRELILTAEQAPKVQAIILAQAQENEAIRTKYAASTDRRAALPELKAAKDKYDAQLAGVLTAGQRTRYAQLREEQQQKRKEKSKDGKVKVKAQS
ncbi:hypothetical protein [Hymenobacter guriensis]|uniref:Periplasmic heavy metal sensor n=1 Tax=Hymenobacter guriensis TaxID=2793065 RepID=A0ABS0L699_9BACT|nr:hypothetical protein [Hymenobacter guriensis]MBG8555606.1 hypothetical protein [Hymenobacter guriensis]